MYARIINYALHKHECFLTRLYGMRLLKKSVLNEALLYKTLSVRTS